MPWILGGAAADGRDDAQDLELAVEEPVMRLGVVPGVAEQDVEAMSAESLADDTPEFDVVTLGTAVYDGRQEQVRANVNHGRKLGIAVFLVGLVAMAASRVVSRYVSRLQPRGVHGGLLVGPTDQPPPACDGDCGVQEPPGTPFFTRRSSA